jgi:membrane protease YdiL (CAAX protease family)
MSSRKISKKEVLSKRFSFFFESLIVFLGIFLFSIIPAVLPGIFIEETSPIYGILYFSLRALIIIIAIPLFIYLSTFLIASQRDPVREANITPSKNYLRLYKVTKKNYKFQILFGLLILFLIFIPMDFLTYLFIPEMIEYTADSLLTNTVNSYLTESYLVFLFSVIIIQFSVGIYEESLARGYIALRANEYMPKMSAVVISSLFFGFGHFAYILIPGINFPIIFPIIWFLQTFFVGIVLSILVIRKKWLFPAIIAHAINNIISAHAIWNYLQGNDFEIMIYFMYIPLLIISGILLFWQLPRIKEGLKTGISEVKSYFDSSQSAGINITKVIVDIIIAILAILVGVLIL